MRAFCLLLAVAAAPALAQSPATTETPAENAPVENPRLMRPGNLDVRGTLNTDILLVYIELGAGADFGLIPIGPGTLSVGGEFDFGFCASLCLVLNAATGLRWGHRFYSPYARVGYHFPIKSSSSTMQKIDLYGLGIAGLVLTSTGASNADNSIAVTGTDTSFGVGLGAGVNFFLGEKFFLGAEGRLRYAQGEYALEVKAGRYTIRDADRRWSLSGFHLMLFAGARLF